MESDHEPLLQPPIKLYRRRWYILGLFSAVAVLQGKRLSPIVNHTSKSKHVSD